MSANPIILEYCHHNPISESYIYDKFESLVWVESGRSDRVNWAISKSKAGSNCEDLLSIERDAARGSATTWNGFQKMTAEQFATRAEAATAWNAYKSANGIVTGTTRSMAQRSAFLKGAAASGKYPSWMKPWLSNGKVPPGYHVDHYKALFDGGLGIPANMRLKDISTHIHRHRYYRQ
ncbi:MAG: hypothetical protein AAF348_19400 [Bacteroidota bacterium]